MKKSIERTEFGQRLFDARTSAGIKQDAAARAIGISQGTLAELEKKGHSSGRVAALAQLYGVSPVWLASGEGDRHRAESSVQRLSLGFVAAAIARSSVSLDARTRRKLAQDVAFMIENGPRESETSAIDALATVDVSLQLSPPPAASPIGVEFLDLDQEVEATLKDLAVASKTMTPTQRAAMVAALRGNKGTSWDTTGDRRFRERETPLTFEPRADKPKRKKAGQS